MKKILSITLVIVLMLATVAISVTAAVTSAPAEYFPADYDYAYKLVEHMKGSMNAGTGVSTQETDAITFILDGGFLVKYTDFGVSVNGTSYKGCAQWRDDEVNKKLTFALNQVEAGTYKLVIFSIDGKSRGKFDVSANGTALGTVDFLYPKADRMLIKHEFETEFVVDGTNPASISLSPAADTTATQTFVYALALVKVEDKVPVFVTTDDGASIRLNQVNGMRFYTTVDMDKINEFNKENLPVQFGTLIAPANLVDGELTHEIDENNYVDVKYTVLELWKGNRIVGSIVNVKDANISRDFVARGYVKIGDTYYYSATTCTRNLAGVADAYIKDATGGYDALGADTKALVDSWAAKND